MNSKRILCPVDFSPCSQTAFEHAVELARASDATLVLLHVMPPPPTYVSGYAGYGWLPPYNPKPDTRLEAMEIPGPELKVERVHLVGIEGETIVRYANQSECDLIIMGTHGYGGFTRFLLGSVADYVIRHAKCPVSVVKDNHRESDVTVESAGQEAN
ncbi:MAG: universal stress protein [Planctomycetota bacterium]